MASSPQDYEEIEVRKSSRQLSAKDVIFGVALVPTKIVETYEDDEYEIFIAEWVLSLKSKYHSIFKAKGGGDMGCDVMGFYGPAPSDRWDNYQCKHYKDPLSPSDITTEITKLIYYVFTEEYLSPENYYFVAPKGLSTQSLGLLRNVETFRERIIKDWNDNCPNKDLTITDKELKIFVDGFDLKKVKTIEPQDIINQHSHTRWHVRRFGGGLAPRPSPQTPPQGVQSSEAVYVKGLQDVYSEDSGTQLSLRTIQASVQYKEHFNRQRKNFYCAESLKLYARESLPDNGEFEDLQEQLLDGVFHIAESNHTNSLAKVNAVLGAVPSVAISDHVLISVLKPADRHGICHQLVNDKKLKWKK